jgi:hypothetical protein
MSKIKSTLRENTKLIGPVCPVLPQWGIAYSRAIPKLVFKEEMGAEELESPTSRM